MGTKPRSRVTPGARMELAKPIPCSAVVGEPDKSRAPDAEDVVVRSGVGGRRVTALVWKSRVSRKRKAVVTEMVRRTFPDATDKGEALEMTVEGGCKDIWIFMLCKDFRHIRAGGAERGESKGESKTGACSPTE